MLSLDVPRRRRAPAQCCVRSNKTASVGRSVGLCVCLTSLIARPIWKTLGCCILFALVDSEMRCATRR